ncbi:MAG: transcription antitermination factor NusB [Mycobacteriales bacterium]
MTPVPAPGRNPSRPYRRPASDPARRAAYDVLRAVEDRGAYANLVLPGLLRERRLDTRDAAFATELAYGTLRAQGTLDAILGSCASRPLAEVDPAVRAVLRLGAYQLLRTRIPVHAAVSASVDLARTVTSEGPAKFANAVLRRVAEHDLAQWLVRLAPAYDEDPVAHLALNTSHPAWVVSAFRDALRGDLAETTAALAADDLRPLVHLVARPGRLSRHELLDQVGPAGSAGPWSPYAVALAEGDPGGIAAVRDGRAGVQDEGSQLCAQALAQAPLAGPDRRWLDLCAGPGGKAALLAGLAGARGAVLVAAEKAPHRARLVAQALAGSGASALTVVADGRAPAWRDGGFDRVLVDAPCSGLGALRRRPEARWRRSPADLPELTRLQRSLLSSALAALRPGGVAAYVVCSPHLAETAAVAADAVAGRLGAPVEALDARPLLPGVPLLGDGPSVQLWPHRHGTDAMFLALLRRR